MNLAQISEQLVSGDAAATSVLVNRALKENYSAEAIVRQGLIAGIESAEVMYRNREMLIPEIRMAARALNRGIRNIQAAIDTSYSRTLGSVILGTVEGEYEDIHKNLLAIMMRCLGLRVFDLGTGVSHALFLEKAVQEKAGVICINTTRTLNPVPVKNLVQGAITRGLRKKVKIILSGAPITEGFCRSIGADFYAPDVASAAEYAASCYQNRRN
ncbi:MAG: cobalamin-dependent protein [Spirochaetaceae bacterium]|jgi:methanogenic corrinoid protein MtbC1|nr:cobalamin-dependent protein [Spirochaetaceae bacterium]